MNDQDLTIRMREGGKAVIITHNAVMGESRRTVRQWSISRHPENDTVTVIFLEPRKRTKLGITAKRDNTKFFTVEDGGDVLYDSRDDVPVDMAEWEATAQRFGKHGAGGIIHHG